MIAVVDCGISNIRSIEKALKKIEKEYYIAKKGEDLKKATHIILPGVGAFEEGMNKLVEKGFKKAILEEVLDNKKPIIGICLGMQFLFTKSEEGLGEIEGLDLIKGEVIKFNFDKGEKLKIPHIGWNESIPEENIDLFNEIEEGSNFYFVHSYHAKISNEENKNIKKAVTDYGYKFSSAVQKKNIFGVQFHPEKSQKKGLQLLKNFCEIKC